MRLFSILLAVSLAMPIVSNAQNLNKIRIIEADGNSVEITEDEWKKCKSMDECVAAAKKNKIVTPLEEPFTKDHRKKIIKKTDTAAAEKRAAETPEGTQTETKGAKKDPSDGKRPADKCVSGNCVNGRGVKVFAAGIQYSGLFVNGKMEGTGVLANNTFKYTGQFENDMMNGQGLMEFSDGTKVEGQFKGGKLEGRGTMISPDGTKLEGQFKNNSPDGLITRISPDGTKIIGQYKNKNFDGQVLINWPDKMRYEGAVKDYKPIGQGTLFFADGGKITGEFINGLEHVKGIYTSAGGKKSVGIYKNKKWEENKFDTMLEWFLGFFRKS